MTIAADGMASYTREHGGGTFSAATGEPYTGPAGYAVGMAQGDGATLPADATAESIAETARRVAGEWSARFVGTWVRPDGRIAIDPVRVLTDRAVAELYGRAHGQDAIWSFALGEAIELA